MISSRKPLGIEALSILLSSALYLTLMSMIYIAGVNIILALAAFLILLFFPFLQVKSVKNNFLFGLMLVAITMSTVFSSVWIEFGIRNSTFFLLIFEVKTLFILLIFVFGINDKKLRKIWINDFYPFILLAILSIVRINSLNTTTFAYLRNFITPSLILFVSLFFAKNIDYLQFNSFMKNLTIIIFISAVIELIVGIDSWYSFFNLDAITSVKGPTSLVTGISGFTVSRLLGLVGNAIALGYILSGLCFWHFVNKNRTYFLLSLCPLILTFAKAGFLTLGIALMWHGLFNKRKYKRKYKRNPGLVLTLFFFLPFPLFTILALISTPTSVKLLISNPLKYFQGDSTAFTHGVGLLFGMKNLFKYPFGIGTGSGGNFANIFENTDRVSWIQSGSESSLGVISSQLGIIGFVLFFMGMYVLNKKILHLELFNDEPVIKYFGLLLGWFLASFFSENALGPSSSFLPIMISVFLIYGKFLNVNMKRLE